MSGRNQTDAAAATLYAVISYVHGRCNADLLDAIDELGLTATQVKLLHRLQHAPRAPTVSDVAGLCRCGRPHASRVVAELEGRGLVELVPDARDGRRRRVILTPAGQTALRRLSATRHGHCARFIGQLPEEDRGRLHAALEPIAASPSIAPHRPA